MAVARIEDAENLRARRAYFSGVDPDGKTTTSPATSVTVNIPQFGRLSLVKEAALATSPAKVGDEIKWKFVVANTGTITIAQVKIVDPLYGLSAVKCPADSLLPGRSIACSATSTVTPTDVQTGWLINDATATGVVPTGPTSPRPWRL